MNVETMIKSIPVTEIHRDHKNSRQFIDPKALGQLQADIRENGLINPITVVPGRREDFA